MQENFDMLIENYKKLQLDKKKENLVNELKEMIAVYVYIAESNNIPIQLLKTKEILDINFEKSTEDDYIEAIYAYFNVLKEIVSKIIDVQYFN